jgi:hypothetical protein
MIGRDALLRVRRRARAHPYPELLSKPSFESPIKILVIINLAHLGNHFSQFLANSSTFPFVTGIRSALTKLDGGFLWFAALS